VTTLPDRKADLMSSYLRFLARDAISDGCVKNGTFSVYALMPDLRRRSLRLHERIRSEAGISAPLGIPLGS
jgi:hypothetical protein